MTATPSSLAISDLLRAIDDPSRLRLLRLLSRMELAVGELAEVLEQSQPRISRHIRILTEAGLVEKRKEGSWVFLKTRLGDSPSAMMAATDRLLAAAEEEDAGFAADAQGDLHRLAAIRAAREESAEYYFARHAEEWDRLRSLHSDDALVEARLGELLGLSANEGEEALGDLLDIGTGTGRMAELFAAHARHVTAIDKSADMLRVARARLQHLPPARLNLLQGDFTELPFSDGSFDTVLFHQVLHYAQLPELALAEAARVTRPGGRVVIVDFAAHRFEELRERDAHARLGFTDGQMASLLGDAGFTASADAAIEGGELTVRIWVATRADTIKNITPLRKAGASSRKRSSS
ncbi:ArsR/SmtB family transcription factor [Croceicoccus mobilis]|uniref:ArsR family transcriptional regulator n=1 Tax=Croceicoccus mobilis TaxID=1703339 RepID=A0A916Z1B1_9SPHN|nr:metalloregulator ArsR/SmtB family transcription factor [Croceicoccus mobilis]GGD71865.1 ArsR family transcriptional regulator [Croceicoccus mobilis]